MLSRSNTIVCAISLALFSASTILATETPSYDELDPIFTAAHEVVKELIYSQQDQLANNIDAYGKNLSNLLTQLKPLLSPSERQQIYRNNIYPKQRFVKGLCTLRDGLLNGTTQNLLGQLHILLTDVSEETEQVIGCCGSYCPFPLPHSYSFESFAEEEAFFAKLATCSEETNKVISTQVMFMKWLILGIGRYDTILNELCLISQSDHYHKIDVASKQYSVKMLFVIYGHIMSAIVNNAQEQGIIELLWENLPDADKHTLDNHLNDLREHNDAPPGEFEISEETENELARRFEKFLVDFLKHETTGKLLKQLQTTLNTCSEEFLG